MEKTTKKKSMKKKVLAGTSLALVAGLAIGGTIAYLKDTDSDVNVMTLGKVSIKQIEQQRVNDNENQTELEPFEQGKTILPAVYKDGSIPWAPEDQWVKAGDQAWKVVADNENVIDKFVTVENTGTTDAYVRTVLAIEVGPDGVNEPYMHIVHNGTNVKDAPTWDFEFVKDDEGNDVYVNIGGTTYVLFVGTYTDALPAGETTIPSLKQIYLDKTATNEVVELYGDTYDVLAFSQAVQTSGFSDAKTALDEAFGEITATNHPWNEVVSSADELTAALESGATSVVLDADVTLPETLEVNGELSILGNGNTLTAPAGGTRVINVDGQKDATVLLSGVTLDGGSVERGISFYNNEGKLDVTIVDSTVKANHYGVNVASGNENAVLTVKDSTLEGYCAFQTWSANTVATFDNCALNGVNKWSGASNNFATVVVNEGADNSKLTFNNCTISAEEQGDAIEYHLIDNASGTTVEWNNCTFVKNGTVSDISEA